MTTCAKCFEPIRPCDCSVCTDLRKRGRRGSWWIAGTRDSCTAADDDGVHRPMDPLAQLVYIERG